jgi:hypothetical protein
MIFAGGDIAPVEPAAAAPAADCSDFYGSIGLHYATASTEVAGVKDRDLFDQHKIGAIAVVGVEKSIAYGIGFGAEIAGWTSLGATPGGDWIPRTSSEEGAELSMFYLTASFGNTAIKAGRYALPKALSPYAWTDSTNGIKDITFEGVLVANTDLADTTLYATYVHSYVNGSNRTHIGGANDELGLFAAGFVNSSIADVKLSGVGYYIPRDFVNAAGDEFAAYAGFLTADTTVAGLKASVRVGVAAGDDEATDLAGNTDATFGLSAKIAGNAGMFNWDLSGTYISDGGFNIGYLGAFNPFYTSASQIAGVASSAVEANVYAKIGPGKLNARLKYTTWDTTAAAAKDDSIHARLGYGMKVFGDVSAKVEYRYTKTTTVGGTETENNCVRVDATYKF